MRVVILHSGPISELIIASSVNRGIEKQPISADITWVVLKEHKYIFRYNKNINHVLSFEEFAEKEEEYDLLINLWPGDISTKSIFKESTGFGCYVDFDKYKEAVMGSRYFPELSSLQLYFYLSGMTWRGEGYDINYYPRTKTKKNKIGVSAANANLRNYVLDNLEVDNKKIWYIPYKKNIHKKMDEINRCGKIITDDLTTLHLALSLRKYVYYLETYPHTLRLELFNNGKVYPIPYNYLK